MRRETPKWLRWSIAAVWAGVIFYASSRTGDSLPGGFSVEGHMVEYFVFGALLTWALVTENLTLSAVVFAILLASIYGVTDEYHQHFVVGRTPDMADWVLDTVGATAGAFLARALVTRSRRRRAQQQAGTSD